METSVIKGPMTLRTKRISKDPPPTPLLVQSRLQGWNECDAGDAGPSKFPPEISPYRQFGMHPRETRKHQQQPEKVKPSMLLGFQNSFIPPRQPAVASDMRMHDPMQGFDEIQSNNRKSEVCLSLA